MSKIPVLRRIQATGQQILATQCDIPLQRKVSLIEVRDNELRKLFDHALDLVHYAKSCQRVGRCMRLAIASECRWVGGIVLGSTFPNVGVRDEALGLKKFVTGFASRGLKNPWSRANREYWGALQTIVNHARTFIFPEFQGQGLGKAAHRVLLTTGIRVWERKYGQKIYALDTLCDHSDSGLFLANGWKHVGETRGYTADYTRPFSARKNPTPSINNAALRLGATKWQVWVRPVRPNVRPR
jgi:GNAT superfamily N-acetyltransferase